MTAKLEQLQQEARGHLAKARAIVTNAETGKRDLTTAEREEHEIELKKVREMLPTIERLKQDKAILDESRKLMQQIGEDELGHPTDRPTVDGSGSARRRKAWGVAVAKQMESTASTYGVKALATGDIDVPSPVLPGIVTLPQQPVTIFDLIKDRAGVPGNEYSFVRQVVRTNNAAPVADGATKPTSVYTYQEVSGQVQVIAHLSEPIPERMLADHGDLERVLADDMAGGVEAALAEQIVNGDGTGANLTGIAHTVGITNVAYATDMLTTMRKARTTMFGLGELPTAWALSAADWETIELLKDTTGRYLGPDLDDVIFGSLPRVVVPGLTAGHAYLADWSACRIFLREQATLAADRSGELFTKNQVKLRVEGRFGFGVLRPQAFAKIALTATP